MKIAVTGARGFVGRHVLAELARRDVDVVASYRPLVRPNGPAMARLQWVSLDLASPPEDCLHGPASSGRALASRLGRFAQLSVVVSCRRRDAASFHLSRERRAQRAVRRSSSQEPASNTDCSPGLLLRVPTPVQPRPTGIAKDTLRRRLQTLQAECSFSLTWARLFYMYGDDQPATSLWPSLKAAALAGRSEFPMSGGEQLRDYLPVEEVARSLGGACTRTRRSRSGQCLFRAASLGPRLRREQNKAERLEHPAQLWRTALHGLRAHGILGRASSVRVIRSAGVVLALSVDHLLWPLAMRAMHGANFDQV